MSRFKISETFASSFRLHSSLLISGSFRSAVVCLLRYFGKLGNVVGTASSFNLGTFLGTSIIWPDEVGKISLRIMSDAGKCRSHTTEFSVGSKSLGIARIHLSYKVGLSLGKEKTLTFSSFV